MFARAIGDYGGYTDKNGKGDWGRVEREEGERGGTREGERRQEWNRGIQGGLIERCKRVWQCGSWCEKL